jgi:hypothetical protein
MVGFTLGIVVQNNDPQKRGRVKVFIPHLSMNLLEGWDNLTEDKSFVYLSDPKIKDVIDKIKEQLPWANCAAPIFGENGNHYFNAASKTSDKSDNKKAKSYEDSPPTDNFGKSYKPSAYNDSAKGLFSIPKVGSRVWVFFENNNLNRPVYFATSYDKEDWETIHKEAGDYPDELENNPDGKDTQHKNKTVISQNGAVIEIVNTEGEEEIKITHHSGSYISWKNDLNEEFVEGSERKLIRGGQTLHVGGNVRLFIDGTYTVESTGNMTFKAPRIDFNPPPEED